jgi:hypothetical protein
VPQPRGIGDGLSIFGGGIGGRDCAKLVGLLASLIGPLVSATVLATRSLHPGNGSIKVARHATNTALRSHIEALSRGR